MDGHTLYGTTSFGGAHNAGTLWMVDLSEDVVGDLNGDDRVNFSDLTPFVVALTDVPTYEAMYPGLDRLARCDASGDGACNFSDLTPFALLLTASTTDTTAVPEPTAWAMGTLLVLQTLLSRCSRSECRTTGG